MQVNTINSYSPNLNFQNTNKKLDKKFNTNKSSKTLQDCALLTSLFALITGFYTLEPTHGARQINGRKITLGLLCTSLALLMTSKLVKRNKETTQ